MVLLQRRLPWPVMLAAFAVRVPLRLLGTARWRGAERLPDGGVILAVNHVSWLDPVSLLDALVALGPVPRILAKHSLFTVPVLAPVLRSLGAVPVQRGSANAAAALAAAQAALAAGDRVVIYPDGTLTKDPQGWPMVGTTGVARLALRSGAPVVPVAQWGAQQLLPRQGRPRFLPRPHLDVLVGQPIDLSAYQGGPTTAAALREVTDIIVAAIVALLEEVRGAPAPPRWDPRTGSRRDAGAAGAPR